MIRAEIKPRPLPRPPGDRLEKLRPQHPVLVVAFLGPRIGEENPKLLDSDPGGKGVQKFPGFRPDEMAIGQAGPVRFAQAAADALAAYIHAEAVLKGKLRGIAGEEMAMPTPDFPDNGPRPGQQGRQPGAQGGAPSGDLLDEFGFESHAPNWREPAHGATPKRDSGRTDSFHGPGAARNPSAVALAKAEAQDFCVRGSRSRMASPCPSVLSAQTRPPWSCTMCLTMLRPSPVPPVSRERPFSTR